tara:strand:- start:1417 stop:1524 length:108 start_codon:yes stop_codon:yes gene_type:complete
MLKASNFTKNFRLLFSATAMSNLGDGSDSVSLAAD